MDTKTPRCRRPLALMAQGLANRREKRIGEGNKLDAREGAGSSVGYQSAREFPPRLEWPPEVDGFRQKN